MKHMNHQICLLICQTNQANQNVNWLFWDLENWKANLFELIVVYEMFQNNTYCVSRLLSVVSPCFYVSFVYAICIC